MTDGAALLEAIRANPDEDTPRLAYADWLDESATTEADPARARFIRLQVERATIGPRRRSPLLARAEQLDAEVATLLNRFRDVWLEALPAAARRPLSDEFLFSRGFLNMVQLSAAEVPTGSPGPWAREPVAYAALTGPATATPTAEEL